MLVKGAPSHKAVDPARALICKPDNSDSACHATKWACCNQNYSTVCSRDIAVIFCKLIDNTMPFGCEANIYFWTCFDSCKVVNVCPAGGVIIMPVGSYFLLNIIIISHKNLCGRKITAFKNAVKTFYFELSIDSDINIEIISWYLIHFFCYIMK